jgi:hypothetical protein
LAAPVLELLTHCNQVRQVVRFKGSEDGLAPLGPGFPEAGPAQHEVGAFEAKWVQGFGTASLELGLQGLVDRSSEIWWPLVEKQAPSLADGVLKETAAGQDDLSERVALLVAQDAVEVPRLDGAL